MQFDASGEPPTGEKTDMLAVRDGPIEITPQLDGPLMVRGNMEIRVWQRAACSRV